MFLIFDDESDDSNESDDFEDEIYCDLNNDLGDAPGGSCLESSGTDESQVTQDNNLKPTLRYYNHSTKYKEISSDHESNPTFEYDVCYMSQESLMKCLSKHCCRKCCIQALSPDRLNLRPAYEIIQTLRGELIGLNKLDKDRFLRAKIAGTSNNFI